MDNLSPPVLPKDKKQVLAKIMIDLNYSATEIAKLLGINRSTVYRYAEAPSSKDLQQFATEIKIYFLVKQRLLLAKILAQIGKAVPDEWDIKSLSLSFKVISESLKQIEADPELCVENPLLEEIRERFL